MSNITILTDLIIRAGEYGSREYEHGLTYETDEQRIFVNTFDEDEPEQKGPTYQLEVVKVSFDNGFPLVLIRMETQGAKPIFVSPDPEAIFAILYA